MIASELTSNWWMPVITSRFFLEKILTQAKYMEVLRDAPEAEDYRIVKMPLLTTEVLGENEIYEFSRMLVNDEVEFKLKIKDPKQRKE